MAEPSSKGASTRVSRVIKASHRAIYQAFLDPDALASSRSSLQKLAALAE
jgi:hypothetical protein